ncbi:MAG: ketopantoate reductase family protein [Bacteroidales bacterium]|nr:ketopantoate reductase family protein [Bacteroidales bacterium]
MSLKNTSILVVGAGSVGGITGAILKNAGFNVEIVCKHEDYKNLISDKGIKVAGLRGNFNEKLKAYISVSDVKEKKDLILLSVKAPDMIDAAEDVKQLLKDDTLVVSMQNGICEPELSKILGESHVVGCIVGWGATMNRPGELKMTSAGDFVIGHVESENDDNISAVAAILENIWPVRITDNMMGHLYSKLVINSCITSMGAVTGLLLGEMMNRRRIRKLFIEIIREALEVAYVLKIDIEAYGGKLDYYDFANDSKRLAELRRHIILRLMGYKYRRLKSSSLQSLQRGKLTEIDYLNGYIAAAGEEYGVPTPVNSAVVRMVHEIEDGKRKISPVNLESEAFEKYYY